MKCVTWMLNIWIEGTITHFTMKKKIINKGMTTKLDKRCRIRFSQLKLWKEL